MERIMIIGCSGSGKTTLAMKLSEKLSLPLVHLDKLYWTGHWETVDREEFNAMLLKELEKDRWIIDGNYNSSISLRLKYCDTVIYLDFSCWTCLFGVISRVIKSYGKTRPDMGGDCPEKFDLDFIKFIWSFNKKNRERYLEMLQSSKDKRIIILHNRRECAEFLKDPMSIQLAKN